MSQALQGQRPGQPPGPPRAKSQAPKDGKGGADRREWERSPLVVAAEMIIRDEIYASLSQNISGGGMFLTLPGPVGLGDVVHLQFRLRGRDIVAKAEVVWVAQRRPVTGLRQLPVGIGVKFVDLPDADRQLILNYVHAVMAQR
jgi:Tfp pilus assembly protein PilZ